MATTEVYTKLQSDELIRKHGGEFDAQNPPLWIGMRMKLIEQINKKIFAIQNNEALCVEDSIHQQ